MVGVVVNNAQVGLTLSRDTLDHILLAFGLIKFHSRKNVSPR